jgi:tetratricopeptide (TPR) repeat protein
MDRVEQIRTEAEHALKQQPRLADAHFAMGLYWEKRQDPARALTEYALAEHGLGKSGDLHAAIGRAYRAQGKWNNAIDELERAIEMDPNDYLSMADLATTFSRLRRYEESAKMWNRYLALSPDANQGALIKGNVYLRWQGTVDTLSAILQAMSPELQRRSFEMRVLIARIRNRPQEALAALDELPRQVTEDPEINRPPALLRAQVYSDMGDSAKARIYYDSARVLVEKKARARPDDFRPQIVLGLAYAGLRRSRDAQRAAQRAMALMPASRDFVSGTTAMRGAAEIFAQIPEQHGAAIRLLDQLMRMPAGREASYQWLRVDPAWRPIRSDPRFLQMLARYSQQ